MKKTILAIAAAGTTNVGSYYVGQTQGFEKGKNHVEFVYSDAVIVEGGNVEKAKKALESVNFLVDENFTEGVQE